MWLTCLNLVSASSKVYPMSPSSASRRPSSFVASANNLVLYSSFALTTFLMELIKFLPQLFFYHSACSLTDGVDLPGEAAFRSCPLPFELLDLTATPVSLASTATYNLPDQAVCMVFNCRVIVICLSSTRLGTEDARVNSIPATILFDTFMSPQLL